MINETILLLVYYYNYEIRNHRLLKYVGKNHLGAYLPFDLYLYKPLQEVFSKAILYDYLERMTKAGVKAVNQEIIELVKKEHPKYVLWTSWQYDILPSTLESIRKEGSTVVGWFFDDEWRFDNYSKWWVPYLDYCVTNAIEAVPRYREMGARVIHTIPNTGIAVDRDWSKTEEKYDVSFVGSRAPDREKWINELVKRNMPVHLFGEGWGRYISFEEMVDIFANSKINLNFSRAWHSMKPQIKGRIFQVCMAGGFLLTEYVPDIENYFGIDKEIVCFHNTDELMYKISYYLKHDVERRAIARAGWERATGEYTSSRMVARVFDEIERDVAARGGKRSSPPQKLEIPTQVRRSTSNYHFEWGRALLEENYRGLWKDELTLSISYYPFSIGARYYYITGFFPLFIRSVLVKLYKAMEKSLGKPYNKLVSTLWEFKE